VRHVVLAATLAMMLASPPCLADDVPTFADLSGQWKVKKSVGAMPLTENAKSERATLGTTISISADQITTYEYSHDFCRPRHPTVTLVDTEEELRTNWGTQITGLELPKGRVKPRLPLLDAGCTVALVLDHDMFLWPMGNGYIYTVTRQPR